MNTTFLSTLIFYSNIITVLLLIFITLNAVFWLVGVLQILQFKRHLKMNFNDMRSGVIKDKNKLEMIELYQEKLLQMNIKDFKYIFIRQSLSRMWCDINIALAIFIALTAIYTYLKLGQSPYFGVVIEEGIGLYLSLIILFILVIPLTVYYVFTDKLEQEKVFKLRCQRSLREYQNQLKVCQTRYKGIFNDDAHSEYKSLEQLKLDISNKPDIYIPLLDNESIIGYEKRCLDEIAIHTQAVRCYKFIISYFNVLQLNCGSDPQSNNLINLLNYIRSRNSSSIRHSRRLFDFMLREAVSSNDLLMQSQCDKIWPELKLKSDLLYIGAVLGRLYGKDIDRILGNTVN